MGRAKMFPADVTALCASLPSSFRFGDRAGVEIA